MSGGLFLQFLQSLLIDVIQSTKEPVFGNIDCRSPGRRGRWRLLILILLAHVSLLTSLRSAAAWQDAGAQWPAAVTARLEQAGANRAEMRRALADCPAAQRGELAFLIEHMPPTDLETLEAGYLLENIRLACEARQSAVWKIPDSLFLNDVLPYACVDETRESWRAAMRERCWPIVEQCRSPGEAAQKLNRELFPQIQVRYSTSREKPNQSPAESIRQSAASCTGLSILLVDACRSVGVPARLAGTPAWTTKRGNHTWVEIWDDGWHFAGAAEPVDEGLNHAWFTGDAARADDSQPAHRIYATSYATTGMHFPLVWSPENTQVPAINVTRRYTSGQPALPPTHARVLIKVLDDQGQRIAIDVQLDPVAGNSPDSRRGTSRAGTADMNDVLEFQLPRGQTFVVQLRQGERVVRDQREVADREQCLWQFEWQQP